MKLLVVVSSPGPAESLAVIAERLRAEGDEVLIVNVCNDNGGVKPGDGRFPGCRGTLRAAGVEFLDSDAFCDIPDYFAVSPAEAAKLIRALAPEKILVGTFRDLTRKRVTLEDAIIPAARAEGVPVFQFVDYWDNWFRKSSDFPLPDALFIHDALAGRLIEKRGGRGARMVVAGNPGFEEFLAARKRSTRLSKAAFGWEGRRVIAYFGQCAPVRNDLALPWLVSALDPGDVFLFRRHPRDRRDYPAELLARGVDAPVSSDDLLDLLDVCVTHTSTMGVKAAALGIRTISLTLPGECDELVRECGGTPLAVMGGSVEARGEKELREALRKEFTPGEEFIRFVRSAEQGNGAASIEKILRG